MKYQLYADLLNWIGRGSTNSDSKGLVGSSQIQIYFKQCIFEGGGLSSDAVNVVLNQPGDVVVTGKYSN